MALDRAYRRLTTLLSALPLLAAIGACSEPQSDARFVQEQEQFIAKGGFRTDRLAKDLPVSAAHLAKNFERVAFGTELDIRNGQYVALPQQSDAVLLRWERPIRYTMVGGYTEKDRRDLVSLVTRLRAATKLDIAQASSPDEANLHIHFLGASDRSRHLRDLGNSRLAELFGAWSNTSEWPCTGEFYAKRTGNADQREIVYGVLYIRNELQGLYRRSCIEEELSQLLGLSRDDPAVRPSIFSDSEEFVLLTRHDWLLLRILYDQRLRTGLTAPQARPIVSRIAEELMARERGHGTEAES